VVALLRSSLQRLQITQADQVIFIADGAPWRWKRVPLLGQALGLAAEQVHEVLDFYHAAEHLGKGAALRQDWSAKTRSQQDPQTRDLTVGEAVKAMVLNGLGFVNQAPYLVPMFFQNKPCAS
jgi:hypothetical protein